MRDFKNDSAKTLSRFGRDKREEATTNQRAERRPRLQRDAADSEQRAPRRASYNPNFTDDNRPKSGNGGARKPYGERKEFGERKPFGERKEFGDRKPYGERKEFGDRKPFGERKEFGDRKPFGERKEYGEHKPYGERKEFGDRKPFGERKEFGDRKPYGERKEFGDRKPFGERKQYGDRKPFGERKEYGERRDKFERPDRPANNNYPKYNPNTQTGEIRLNRYIAQSGLCSRREADDYIAAGVVTVNGVVVKELGTKVMPTDEIKFNDEQVQSEKKVYLVLNKPKGFVTSSDDPHADKTVMDLVRNACTERIYPVGRLDKNSLGVLLFTNDGDLTKQLTHPSHRKKKIYQVSLDKPLTRADLDALASGITLEDGDIFADEISYVSENREEVGMEIHSGRNRIVRRMFEHLGYSVQKLDRVYFAGLTKKNLKRGQWRFLTNEEVERLKSGRYE
ncbi:MAG: pseudouridine synthase [Rikenellaceae bacterium]